jgi:transaldolase
MMKIFIDSANINEIQKWLKYGIADGATSNPSIMFKDGVHDIEQGTKRIAAILGDKPFSVEVTTNDTAEMLKQGRTFAKWAPNLAVKIPIINASGEPCLEVISTLEKENIRVNTTAIMSFGQLVMAAKAGSTYVSIFAGRVSDEGNDPVALIKKSREWLDLWGYKSEIIVGSIREVISIQNAAIAGAHIITVPPQFLKKLVDHKYTRETVKEFISDAEKSVKEMQAMEKVYEVVDVAVCKSVDEKISTPDEIKVVKKPVENKVRVS